MHSGILYRNNDDTIFLVDIPRSIEAAQTLRDGETLTHRLKSCPALERPFVLPEPRLAQAREKVKKAQGLEESFPRDLLQDALFHVQSTYQDIWCHDRVLRDEAVDMSDNCDDAFEQSWSEPERRWSEISPLRVEEAKIKLCSPRDLANRVICNQRSQLSTIIIDSKPTARYRIPAQSSFLLAKITSTSALQLSMGHLELGKSSAKDPSPNSPRDQSPLGQYNVIVIDPPWQNRSAKRSKSYRLHGVNEDPFEILRATLTSCIADAGLVACWITNKMSIRKIALDAFADWGIQLVEEWAWLKVTECGIPVVPLDSVWKLPYELLLIGRRVRGPSQTSELKRRVILAVPDLHSRKPCLKEMLMSLDPDLSRCRGLEIFARSLTAGWSAWGDECLKFAEEKEWQKDTSALMPGLSGA